MTLAAQEDLEKALSLSPDDKNIQKKLATLAKKSKQYENWLFAEFNDDSYGATENNS